MIPPFQLSVWGQEQLPVFLAPDQIAALSRWIKTAGRKLEMPWVNWLLMRRSHDNWLRMAGADLKDRQAQMRHAHPIVTAEVYDQFIPENQRNVVDKLGSFVTNVTKTEGL